MSGNNYGVSLFGKQSNNILSIWCLEWSYSVSQMSIIADQSRFEVFYHRHRRRIKNYIVSNVDNCAFAR